MLQYLLPKIQASAMVAIDSQLGEMHEAALFFPKVKNWGISFAAPTFTGVPYAPTNAVGFSQARLCIIAAHCSGLFGPINFSSDATLTQTAPQAGYGLVFIEPNFTSPIRTL